MDKKYYIAVDGTRQGPFTLQELTNRGLSADTLVWTKGMANWAEAGTVPELADALDEEPPELPGQPTEPTVPQPEVTDDEIYGCPPDPEPAPQYRPTPVQPDPWQQSAAQEQAQQPSKKGHGKWILAGVVLLLLIVMLVSRPSRQSHEQAIVNALSSYVADQVDSSLVGAVPLLAGVVKDGSNQLIETYVDSNLELDDYFVLNVGRMPIGESKKKVSLGILGHVFTFDKEDVAKAVNHYLFEQEEAAEVRQEQQSVGTQIGQAIDSVSRQIDRVTNVVERVTNVIDGGSRASQSGGDDDQEQHDAQVDSLARRAADKAQQLANDPEVQKKAEGFIDKILKALGLE